MHCCTSKPAGSLIAIWKTHSSKQAHKTYVRQDILLFLCFSYTFQAFLFLSLIPMSRKSSVFVHHLFDYRANMSVMKSSRQLTKHFRRCHKVNTRQVSTVLTERKQPNLCPLVKDNTKPKQFEDIPGPRNIPVIGTLWQYLPGGRCKSYKYLKFRYISGSKTKVE